MDTGLCAPESEATLAIQQTQLIAGRRHVQMFPVGTVELALPIGFERFQNERGIFHYNGKYWNSGELDRLSREGRENVFLMLGHFSKPAIEKRYKSGEALIFVTEYTPLGVEVRCAAGTVRTAPYQIAYFERTKEQGSVITVGAPPERVQRHLTDMEEP